MATVLSPLIRNTEHHVKNLNKFAKEVREINLDHDEELQSYDMSALFTSVRIDKEVIKVTLKEENTLSERRPLETDYII